MRLFVLLSLNIVSNKKNFLKRNTIKKAAGILIGQIDSLKDRVTEYINDGIIISIKMVMLPMQIRLLKFYMKS